MADGGSDTRNQNGDDPNLRRRTDERPFIVMVSAKFIVLGLLSSMLLAFSVGRAARIILIEGPRQALLAPHDQSTLRNRPDYHEGYARSDSSMPPPIARKGKEVPKTVYTSKNFDTARSATSSSLLIRRSEDEDDEELEELDHVCVSREDGTKQCSRSRPPTSDEYSEEHLPAGQHLLVDMANVDGEFLNSEEQLATAMIKVVDEADLTLLSYHCHSLLPAGVSCVGVLLESHVSFHTWPAESVITLDLFTCGSAPLVPVVPIIERLFGVPQENTETNRTIVPVQTKWAHKLRGFRKQNSSPLQAWDLGVHILGDIDLEMKTSVVSAQSKYQEIDIVDVIIPRFNRAFLYERSISGDGSYESLHPEYYRPDRIVFLDGTMQSRRRGDAQYHEALVHPGLFAHENPRRVAIIGGGEGATLREVLKHNTIQEAMMIEIDEEMINVSREYLPEWSDCGDLVGSAAWCGEDPRAKIFAEDALAWFRNRYGNNRKSESLIDVIVMDALDPETDVPFAQALYADLDFVKALYNALSDHGVIILQLGSSADTDDPAEIHSKMKNRANLFRLLEDAGFESVHVYDEAHGGFFWAWSIAVAFKDYETRARWYRNEAEIDIEIHQRIVQTKSGKNPLRYFDGPTMISYQIPSKPTEIVFCRNDPTPRECVDPSVQLIPEISNVPMEFFEVRNSTAGKNAGRGLFTTVDIARGSILGAEQTVHSVSLRPSSYSIIDELHDNLEGADDLFYLLAYLTGYGWWHRFYGADAVNVDSGLHTFVNHGCNNTSNCGWQNSSISELTADPKSPPAGMTGVIQDCTDSLYSPFIDRRLPSVTAGFDHALRDIRAGEEILSDYLEFTGSRDDWAGHVKLLRAVCRGGDGEVSKYERMYEEED